MSHIYVLCSNTVTGKLCFDFSDFSDFQVFFFDVVCTISVRPPNIYTRDLVIIESVKNLSVLLDFYIICVGPPINVETVGGDLLPRQ